MEMPPMASCQRFLGRVWEGFLLLTTKSMES